MTRISEITLSYPNPSMTDYTKVMTEMVDQVQKPPFTEYHVSEPDNDVSKLLKQTTLAIPGDSDRKLTIREYRNHDGDIAWLFNDSDQAPHAAKMIVHGPDGETLTTNIQKPPAFTITTRTITAEKNHHQLTVQDRFSASKKFDPIIRVTPSVSDEKLNNTTGNKIRSELIALSQDPSGFRTAGIPASVTELWDAH